MNTLLNLKDQALGLTKSLAANITGIGKEGHLKARHGHKRAFKQKNNTLLEGTHAAAGKPSDSRIAMDIVDVHNFKFICIYVFSLGM